MISYAPDIIAAFKNSQQFYYTVTDPHGTYSYVNPLFAKRFSYLSEDLTGHSSSNIIYPDDLPRYRNAMEACVSEPGIPVTVELRHPSSNGHLYHTRFELTAINSNSDKPMVIQWIGMDITPEVTAGHHDQQLLKMSNELRNVNRELSDILKNASEAIVKLDLEGHMIYMTPEFTKLTGYSLDDVYQQHWASFIHTEDLDTCYDAISKVILQRIVMRNICYRFKQKDETYQWLSSSATLVTDEAGEPLYIICLSTDITERKYVEDALEASEERYRVFIDQSSDGICRAELEQPVAIDLDEESLMQHIMRFGFVAECNDIMENIYSHKVTNGLIGRRVREFIDFSNEKNIELFRAFIRNGFRLSDAESYNFDKHGKPRHYNINLVGIIENGLLKRIWSTQRDITERKLIEERNRYLASLTENVSDAILGGDIQTHIVSVNPAAEKLFGFKANEMIGKRIGELVDLNYHHTTREKIMEHLYSVGTWNGEASFVRASDNKLVSFMSSISLIRDSEGKPIGTVGINKDITDTKAAIERAKHLARLVENTTDMLTSSDLEFRVVSWNKASEKVYGLKTEQVIGRNLREFLPDISYQDCSRDDVRRILAEKGEWRGEMYFTRPTDKKQVTLLMNFTMQRDDEGKQVGYIVGGTDITERKLAEMRIKESEERFRHVADSAPVMVWMCDADNRTIYVNKPWQKFTGLSAKQTVGSGWAKVVHPEDVEKTTIDFDTAFYKREPIRMYYRLRTINGDYRWVLDIGIPRTLDDGTFVGYIGSLIDIHDQKLNEDQLRFQANILSNVSDSVIITDASFNVVSWNKVAEELFGISAREAIGRHMPSLVEFEYVNSSQQAVLDEFIKNGRWKGETSFTNRRGEKKYLLNTVAVIQNPDGGAHSVMAVASDITDLKNAEHQLQKSEKFYRSLIDNSLDGILLSDEKGVITFSAGSLKNILGYESAEVVGKNIFSYIHPDDLRIAEDRFFGLSEPDKEYVVIRVLKSNNEWLWCMIRGHNLLADPEINAFVVYLHDDSLRKKAEDELIESERRLRTAHEIAGLAYMEMNEARELYCSKEIVHVLDIRDDRSPADMNSFLALIHGSDRKKVEEDIDLAFEKGTSFQHEFRLLRWDLPEKIIQSIGSLVTDAVTNQSTLKITIQDVTSIRSAQLALRTSESRFKSLFEHSIDGVLLTQPGGTVKSANPAICEMLGYTHEEILTKKRRDIFDVNDPQFSRIVEAREETGRFIGELTLIHKSGRRIPCEISSVLFRDSEGRAYHSTIVRDITRQKEAEHNLKMALSDLNKILDFSQDVICSFDDNGTFLQVSAASARIWGFAPEEVIGRNVRDFMVPEDIENTMARISRMKAGESVATNFENHFRRKDGSLVTLDWSAYWYKKEKIAFCVARDITLQKEIEQQLIASESRFRSFMDNSPAAAWICDEEGRYVYINKLIAASISKEGYNTIGKSMFDIYPYEFAEKYHNNNLETLRRNYAMEFIEEGVDVHGRPNVFLVYKFPVLIGPGQRGIGGVAIDITDKTKAENALRTSEQNLKAIFSSTRDAFVLVDRDLNLVSFNPIAAELYSMLTEGGHIEDCPDLVMILPPDRQPVMRKYLEGAFNGQSHEYEVQYNIGNASYWFNIVIQPVASVDGKVDRICATISNVTSRKRQEMTLALEKKVLELNASQDTTLADIVATFVKGIEHIYPGMIASVMRLQDGKMRPLCGPSLPQEYLDAIDGLEIGNGVGSCGTAMYQRKRVFVSDIENDPLWKDYKQLALKHNLRACWSIPIINARNEVLASFAIYYTAPKQPMDYEVTAIERAADILRVIVQNKQSEDELRVSNQRYHFVTKATNEAIWDLDLLTDHMFWAEGYYTLFGYDYNDGTGSFTQSQERIHPEDRKRIRISLQNFLRRKTKTRWEDEYRYRKADGTYAYVVDKAYLLIDGKGTPIRMIGSMQDITSRKELEQQLIEQEISKQKLLTQATIDGQEKERREIGKELHDNINQILSTTKLYLDLAQNNSEGSAAEMIALGSRNIMEAINEIRKLSRSLVPPTLGDLGLVESVKDLCENFTTTQAFNVEFVHRNIREKLMPDNQKLMLFRIIQEQTNNIVKHAKARNVKIEMRAIKSLLTLEITDDGKGFDPGKIKKGVGLNNIINRAELFNGKVEIEAVPGSGCSVRVHVPIKY